MNTVTASACLTCGACCVLSTARCPHLDGTVMEHVRCTIYPQRPDICQLFEVDSIECHFARQRWWDTH